METQNVLVMSFCAKPVLATEEKRQNFRTLSPKRFKNPALFLVAVDSQLSPVGLRLQPKLVGR